jgi:hypothetical protein
VRTLGAPPSPHTMRACESLAESGRRKGQIAHRLALRYYTPGVRARSPMMGFRYAAVGRLLKKPVVSFASFRYEASDPTAMPGISDDSRSTAEYGTRRLLPGVLVG